MKYTLTLLALAIAGAAEARSAEGPLPTPLSFRTVSRMAPPELKNTAGAILNAQQPAGAAAKATASAQRLTGWSRRDLVRNAVVDSSHFRYSGSRGSRFADESENLRAGTDPELSNPDYYVNGLEGGRVGRLERVFRYDAGGRVIEEFRRSRGTTYHLESTYDAAGRLQRVIESDSTSLGWEPYMACTIHYNAAGQRSLDSIALLENNMPFSLLKYTYNSAGHMDSLYGHIWDEGAGSWTRDYLLTNIYNASGNLATSTSHSLEKTLALLVPTSRYVYSYNSFSLLTSEVTWAYEEGQWWQRYRDVYTYSGTRPLYTGKTNAYWDDALGAWDDQRMWTYTLDNAGRWSTEIFRRRIDGVMTPETKTTIAYNTDNVVDVTKSYPFDAEQNNYAQHPAEEDRFYYERFQPTGVQDAAVPVMTLYPNPASTGLTMESTEPLEQVQVFNALGACVGSVVANGRLSIRLDVAQLPAGAYILKARSSRNAVSALRFVKQ